MNEDEKKPSYLTKCDYYCSAPISFVSFIVVVAWTLSNSDLFCLSVRESQSDKSITSFDRMQLPASFSLVVAYSSASQVAFCDYSSLAGK